MSQQRAEEVLHRLAFLFLLGSLLGFLMESLQSWLDLGYVENRQGLLYGPFTPIYGLGALLFAFLFPLLRHCPVGVVFLLTGAVGAVFEYLCSLVQETAFGTLSWDYSNIGLDWDGRTNLILALCWGGLGVFFVRFFYPLLTRFLIRQRRPGKRALTAFLLCFFLTNGFLSTAALVRQDQRRSDLPAVSAFSVFLDDVYPDVVLKEIFPNMTAVTPSPPSP